MTFSSGASSLEDLIACREIVSDADRLACFDQTSDQHCKKDICNQQMNDDASEVQVTETKGRESSFGLSEKVLKNEPEQIESSIKDIRFASYGKHVFTLENGQVWMENEPGRKKVKNKNQPVVIKKKNLRYVIKFDSGVTLAVHRIE
jgi:hypothetical protein